jgi:hypothetical protein
MFIYLILLLPLSHTITVLPSGVTTTDPRSLNAAFVPPLSTLELPASVVTCLVGISIIRIRLFPPCPSCRLGSIVATIKLTPSGVTAMLVGLNLGLLGPSLRTVVTVPVAISIARIF